MDYLLERMEAVPCTEIRVVTRPEKQDVVEHCRARGAVLVTARPASVAESLSAGAGGLEGDVVAVFGFPDSIWYPVDGFVRLLPLLGEDVDVVLGIFVGADPPRSDVVELHQGRVVSVDVKPAQPRSELVWGCAALRVGALRAIASEAEPGIALDRLARRGRVAGVRLEDPFVDIGTPEALQRSRSSSEG
jgi:dTDP-glucose pyrophosphorylase